MLRRLAEIFRQKPALGNLKLVVQRDSVCAGDDVDAPNEISLEVEANATVAQVLDSIIDMKYLASIQGGKATWIFMCGKPLAVVAQQWKSPKYLVNPSTPITQCMNSKSRILDFEYRAQQEPDWVFHVLETGNPLPKR